MNASPRFSLAYLQPQQAQKHVTVNEALRRLDALVSLAVKSRGIDAQPASPAEGEAYILTAARTGDEWSTMDAGAIAVFQDGAWTEIAAVDGLCAFVTDEAALIVFSGGVWTEISASVENAPFIGVNTTADTTNRLSVKSDAVLFSHDDVTPGTGDMRQTINKSATAKTASVIFQNAASARAEIGLLGDEDLTLKVTADGSTWTTALVVDKDDATINSVQGLIVGGTAPTVPANDIEARKDGYAQIGVTSNADTGDPSFLGLRSRGSGASPTVVADGDFIFTLLGRGYDGSGYKNAAAVRMSIDGAPGAGDMPGRISFQTTPNGSTSLQARLDITESGNVGIGVVNPSTKLEVDGPVRVKSYTVAGAPSASGAGAGAIIYVSNETGGAVLAFSDGTNWRRVTDRAVIS